MTRIRLISLFIAATLTLSSCTNSDGPATSGRTTLGFGSSELETPDGTNIDPPPLDIQSSVFALAQTVQDCVTRFDTDHPVFHGCVDWHSAVHGNFALRAAGRMLEDDGYIDAAESLVSAEAMERETKNARVGALDAENPYGFSWFLILDTEARDPTMSELAAIVADKLLAWIDSNIDSREAALNPDYHNLGFSAFALHQWYMAFDASAARDLRTTTQDSLLSIALGECHARVRSFEREFLDPCFTLVLAIADYNLAEPNRRTVAALPSLIDMVLEAEPLDSGEIGTVHASGLNFSRSWTLYHLYQLTGNMQLLERGDELVRTHLSMPDYWRDGYRKYGHWVAQFGVLAISLRQRGINPPGVVHAPSLSSRPILLDLTRRDLV